MFRCGYVVRIVVMVLVGFVGLGLGGVAPVWGNWEFQESGVDEFLYDICFIDELYGWIVGNHSTVLATTDGGETWVKQEFPFPEFSLKRVQFLSADIGFIIGDDRWSDDPDYIAYLFRTHNGGKTWEAVQSNFRLSLIKDFSFVVENIGWIVADVKDPELPRNIHHGVLKTTNGGKSWDIQYDFKSLDKPEYYWSVRAVSFFDLNHGWAVYGPSGDLESPMFLLYTEDGGNEWQKRGRITNKFYMTRLQPVSVDTLWVDNLGINTTFDNGDTWVLDENEFGLQWVYDVYPVNGQEAYILTQTRLLYTDDGGVSFTELVDFDNIHKWAKALDGFRDRTVWWCGDHGLIGKYTKSATHVNNDDSILPDEITLHQNTPNPFNPTTTISFDIRETSEVEISVYDITGHKITSLLSDFVSPGYHSLVWNGKNDSGVPVGSGIYLLELIAGNRKKYNKMMLLR